MERVIKTKFWEFNQNNSKGYFVEDDENGVCEHVIIEAQTPDEAWSRLEKIGDKVDGFWDCCSCCGERWSKWFDKDDGKEVPMHCDIPLEEVEKNMFRAFVHYYDGSIKEFKFNDAVK